MARVPPNTDRAREPRPRPGTGAEATSVTAAEKAMTQQIEGVT
jgi:hypothetical protein